MYNGATEKCVNAKRKRFVYMSCCPIPPQGIFPRARWSWRFHRCPMGDMPGEAEGHRRTGIFPASQNCVHNPSSTNCDIMLRDEGHSDEEQNLILVQLVHLHDRGTEQHAGRGFCGEDVSLTSFPQTFPNCLCRDTLQSDRCSWRIFYHESIVRGAKLLEPTS